MIAYQMPGGWQISFPKDWSYENEVERGQSIFYPSNSDLTIRITPFHAERQGTLEPAEVMEAAFIATVPAAASPLELGEYTAENYTVKAFENTETENGKQVFRIAMGCYTAGELLSIHIFSTSKDECRNALTVLKTLRKAVNETV